MERLTNKMECSFIRNNLFAYQEKQLPESKYKEFEDHLLACGECTRIVLDFQSATSFIDEKKAMEPNPFIRTRILQRIETSMERASAAPKPFFQRIFRPVLVSFLFLTGVIIGFSIVKQSESRIFENINHQSDIQAMKSALNITDFIDEDNTFIDNF